MARGTVESYGRAPREYLAFSARPAVAPRGEPPVNDLGHGHRTCDFFDQFPQRMACAKGVFSRPKGPGHAQIREARANLLHLKQEVPLNAEELHD